MSEPEVAPRRLRVAELGLLLARPVVVGGLLELVVVEAGAGEERLLARGPGVVLVLVERVDGEVEDERGVDDPDPGGEVRAAIVHEREAPGAGAVADRRRDPDLQRPVPGARGERVELSLELRGLALESSDVVASMRRTIVTAMALLLPPQLRPPARTRRRARPSQPGPSAARGEHA